MQRKEYTEIKRKQAMCPDKSQMILFIAYLYNYFMLSVINSLNCYRYFTSILKKYIKRDIFFPIKDITTKILNP